jgi:hypothetical protein
VTRSHFDFCQSFQLQSLVWSRCCWFAKGRNGDAGVRRVLSENETKISKFYIAEREGEQLK